MKSSLLPVIVRLFTGCLFLGLGLALRATPFALQDGDRVLFIGDTFFEREVDYGQIETGLTAGFPERKVTFRNLAWAADTPLGRSRASFDWNKPEAEWLQRVKDQVALVKPTVAILSYGTTAALERLEAPPAEQAAKLSKFKTDLGQLMDAITDVSGHPVRFVLLGPPLRERSADGGGLDADIAVSPPDADGCIRATDVAIQEVAAARGARFIPLLDLYQHRTRRDRAPRTEGGFAPNERGNAWAAWAILRQLNLSPQLDQPDQTVSEFLARALDGSEASAPKQLRSPKAAASVAGTPDRGREHSAYQLLRSAIRKKNAIFFHRWRPENWTYLLGFRKQEQGQNAGEILEFGPIVEAWDARIARLRDVRQPDAATVVEVQKLLAAELEPPRDPNHKPQPLPTFEVADGFSVTLWAEDPMLFKPIQMNWDANGRLWLASSRVYPQLRPNEDPADAVIVLEDKDGDGRAETSRVFADGLLIPTGVVPDDQGGCYVAASHQLLHFADRNGDGRADEKRIVLSSFGTEDTHHNLHTLRWGYDGRLYMDQSIYTHSHLETPWGVRRLNSGGIWRFDPDSWRLEIFTKGGCNPWGHHWDQWGDDFFTDGAGFKGLYHALEGATYFTYADMRREAESITPGNWPKFASLELIHSPRFPADWQGDAITCDFRAHRVVRFKITPNGSTFSGKEMPDLLRSTNVTFRPIDVRLGPDGALYVADWSNPIIQHGEVDFRDPRRDHEHGRIWRVVATHQPAVKQPELTRLGIAALLDATLSNNGWQQEQARRLAKVKLQSQSPAKADRVIAQWLARQQEPRAALEALWLQESLDRTDPALLQRVLSATNVNERAAGARYLINHPELPAAPDLLATLVRDPAPPVRLAALRALAKIPTARSAALALSVLDLPMDATLDYGLWLTLNDLADPWIAAIQSGQWQPEGREAQLEFGLKAIPPDAASRVLGQLLASRPMNREGTGPWIEIIGAAGTPKELRRLLDQVLQSGFNDAATVRALQALADASRLRQTKPTGDLSGIGKLLQSDNESVRLQTLKLAGEWKDLGSYFPELGKLAGAPGTNAALRQAAFTALRQIGGAGATNTLVALTEANQSPTVRQEAVIALAGLNLNQALPRALQLAQAITNEPTALELWRGLLSVKNAATALRSALAGQTMPEAAAKAGMRAAREGGRDDVDLVVAFARAGGLSADTTALSTEIIQNLARQAVAQGNPARGELVFRRPELTCLTCHAIAGAGGKVGPDLMSIGASAPPDYIVEALLLPSAKIKEGYPAINIETKDDQSFSGTLARETPEEVVLRTATGAEVSVAQRNIAQRHNGTISLMPTGLMDNLSERDKVDLIAFLSSLGKPGEFDASQGGVARAWHIYALTHTDQQNGLAGAMWQKPLTDKMWHPAFTLANGKLTRHILETSSRQEAWVGTLEIIVATELQTAQAGSVKLTLDATQGELWVEGKRVGGTGESVIALPAGTHRVIVKINPEKIPEFIRLKTSDGTFANH